jgi:hypothetical protein
MTPISVDSTARVRFVHQNETTGVRCQFALLVYTELQTKYIFFGGHTKFHKYPSIG